MTMMDPWTEMRNLQRDMDRLLYRTMGTGEGTREKWGGGKGKFRGGKGFEDFGMTKGFEGKEGKFKPFCDIAETDRFWLLRFELPGVTRDKICIDVNDKVLCVCACRDKYRLYHDYDKLCLHKEGVTGGMKEGVTGGMKEGMKGVGKDIGKEGLGKEGVGKDIGKEGLGREGVGKDIGKDIGKEGLGKEGVRDVRSPHLDERKRSELKRRLRFLKKERGAGTFKRKLTLPMRVEPNCIDAVYKDGILELLIHKPEGKQKGEHSKTQKIPIH